MYRPGLNPSGFASRGHVSPSRDFFCSGVRREEALHGLDRRLMVPEPVPRHYDGHAGNKSYRTEVASLEEGSSRRCRKMDGGRGGFDRDHFGSRVCGPAEDSELHFTEEGSRTIPMTNGVGGGGAAGGVAGGRAGGGAGGSFDINRQIGMMDGGRGGFGMDHWGTGCGGVSKYSKLHDVSEEVFRQSRVKDGGRGEVGINRGSRIVEEGGERYFKDYSIRGVGGPAENSKLHDREEGSRRSRVMDKGCDRYPMDDLVRGVCGPAENSKLHDREEGSRRSRVLMDERCDRYPLGYLVRGVGGPAENSKLHDREDGSRRSRVLMDEGRDRYPMDYLVRGVGGPAENSKLHDREDGSRRSRVLMDEGRDRYPMDYSVRGVGGPAENSKLRDREEGSRRSHYIDGGGFAVNNLGSRISGCTEYSGLHDWNEGSRRSRMTGGGGFAVSNLGSGISGCAEYSDVHDSEEGSRRSRMMGGRRGEFSSHNFGSRVGGPQEYSYLHDREEESRGTRMVDGGRGGRSRMMDGGRGEFTIDNLGRGVGGPMEYMEVHAMEEGSRRSRMMGGGQFAMNNSGSGVGGVIGYSKVRDREDVSRGGRMIDGETGRFCMGNLGSGVGVSGEYSKVQDNGDVVRRSRMMGGSGGGSSDNCFGSGVCVPTEYCMLDVGGSEFDMLNSDTRVGDPFDRSRIVDGGCGGIDRNKSKIRVDHQAQYSDLHDSMVQVSPGQTTRELGRTEEECLDPYSEFMLKSLQRGTKDPVACNNTKRSLFVDNDGAISEDLDLLKKSRIATTEMETDFVGNDFGLNAAPTDEAIIACRAKLHNGLDSYSLGFVYEIPKDSYFKKKKVLHALPPLAWGRLEHMDSVHFMFCQLDKGQASAPKDAAKPHYQVLCSEFIKAALDHRHRASNIKFQIYYPDANYSTDELLIDNDGISKDLVTEEDWEMLLTIALGEDEPEQGKTNKSKEVKRQQCFKDFLFCSSINTTRMNSSAGIALPSLKKDTFSVHEELIKKVCVGISEWVQRQKFKWLRDDEVPYTDPHSKRQMLFAGILDPRNKLEYLRVAATVVSPAGNGRGTVEKKCGVHSDEHNSQSKVYESVPTWSRGIKRNGLLYRLSLVGNSRRSIDQAMEKLKLHGPYIEYARIGYDSMAPHRKVLTQESMKTEAEKINSVPCMPALKQFCNLDPCGHTSSFIHPKMKLQQAFNLSFLERVSLIRAMAVLPHSPYIFGCACEAVLQERFKFSSRHRRGFNFGLLVAKTMVEIKSSLNDDPKLKNPPLRHSLYREAVLPNLALWNDDCSRMVVLCLGAHSIDCKKSGSRSESQAEYKELVDGLAEILPNCSHLICNHLMCAMGQSNEMPFWVTSIICFNPSSKPIKWMLEKFILNMNHEDAGSIIPAKKKTTATKKAAMVAVMFLNLKAALESRTNTKWTWRQLENFVCKLYRTDTGRCEIDSATPTSTTKKKHDADKIYFDVLFLHQNLYTLDPTGVYVEQPDGTNKFHKGGLIPSLLWRGRVISFEKFLRDQGSVTELTPTIMDALSENGLRAEKAPAIDLELNVYKFNLWLHSRFQKVERRLFSR